jgi:hypothetical protein
VGLAVATGGEQQVMLAAGHAVAEPQSSRWDCISGAVPDHTNGGAIAPDRGVGGIPRGQILGEYHRDVTRSEHPWSPTRLPHRRARDNADTLAVRQT